MRKFLGSLEREERVPWSGLGSVLRLITTKGPFFLRFIVIHFLVVLAGGAARVHGQEAQERIEATSKCHSFIRYHHLHYILISAMICLQPLSPCSHFSPAARNSLYCAYEFYISSRQQISMIAFEACYMWQSSCGNSKSDIQGRIYPHLSRFRF